MIAPLRMSWRFASTLFNPMLLLMMPMMSIPTSVPPTVPTPPERLVPADDHGGDGVELVRHAVVRVALLELRAVHDAGQRREAARRST